MEATPRHDGSVPGPNGKMKTRAMKNVSRGTNHQWSREEETNPRWKANNTFKTGYVAYLETLLEQKLPKSKLKADPHIESQVKTMKRQYNAILEMINIGSDFLWNDVDKTVIVSKLILMLEGLRSKPSHIM